jgi:hypothetical protein
MASSSKLRTSYKLLVASIGVASVTYSACNSNQVANLACGPPECGGGFGGSDGGHEAGPEAGQGGQSGHGGQGGQGGA